MHAIISLCFICDENYVMPTIVAITSVIANKNCTDRYDIYVVANSLSDESIAVFREMETENNRIFIIQTAEPDKYDRFVMNHFPKTSYEYNNELHSIILKSKNYTFTMIRMNNEE